jgi:putative phosphoesterase
MKFGVVSDLHCNARGLTEALRLMGDIDEVICLGDSIWEYRFSNEVVAILKERQAHTILGNHEEGFFGPLGERARARPGSDPELLDWLGSRPHRIRLEAGGKTLLLVHSTPWEPRGSYIHPTDSQLARFGEEDADFVLYGHTHAQVVRQFGRVTVVNPGSAGDARDSRNGRLLSCATIDTATGDVRLIDFPDPK